MTEPVGYLIAETSPTDRARIVADWDGELEVSNNGGSMPLRQVRVPSVPLWCCSRLPGMRGLPPPAPLLEAGREVTELDIARNASAIRNLAARLERLGYDGDCHAEAELIAMDLLTDGYRPIEKPPPLRATAELGGPGHREFQAAKEALGQRSKR